MGRWNVVVAIAALLGSVAFAWPAVPELPCGEGLALVTVASGKVWCSHGSDAPPGDTARNQDEARTTVDRSAGPVPELAPQCYDDGVSGERVQVLYLHDAGGTDRSGTLAGDLRRWIGQVEWTVVTSAAATGGRRHVRFVTEAGDAGGCVPEVRSVAVPSSAFDSFQATVDELDRRGFVRNDRKYLVFADVDRGACGVATVPLDDRAGSDNAANQRVGYARIDADCWTTGDDGYYAVAAHELVHTLGAVQDSAPHATPGRHCTDEWDVMCYPDSDGLAVDTVCEDADSATAGDGDRNNRLLDCRHDDYFHTSPAPGSYLATHWNVATSAFLTDHPGSGPGYDREPQVADDPRRRPRVWSGALGVHRPTVPDAYGWEVCDLPITLAVEDAGVDSGGLLGVLGAGGQEPGELRTAAQVVADWVDAAAGRDVLEVSDEPWSGSTPPDGTLVLRSASTTGATAVELRSLGARFRAGTVTVDPSVLNSDRRDVLVLQATVQALGVGRVGGTGDLLSPWPTPGADRRTAAAALRFLYDQPCDVDPRLTDTVAGDPSQRHPGGLRQRIDLATQATTPIAAALDIARWLRDRQGSRWADTAVVCREDVHADCLAGSVLAGQRGPLVFVPGGPGGRLPGSVADELDASLQVGSTVYVLGGGLAVSPEVEDALRAALPGREVVRVAGADRFATAVAVAREHLARGGHADTLVVSRADEPVDAVAAGAAAARFGTPILLTSPTTLPTSTAGALEQLAPTTVLVTGGPIAVSDEVGRQLQAYGPAVVRLAGSSRYETAVAIARAPSLWNRVQVGASGSAIGVNGTDRRTWNLALAAAPVGALLDAPVLFTARDAVPAEPGSTLDQLRDLPLGAGDPVVRSVFVGAGAWASPAVADAFHGALLPGFDGNVRVTDG